MLVMSAVRESKPRSARGFKKRSIFAEVIEGFDALAARRAFKARQDVQQVRGRPAQRLRPREIEMLRGHLALSRRVFAAYFQTSERTLSRWERGLVEPNAQAVVLIRLLQRYPDMIGRVAEVGKRTSRHERDSRLVGVPSGGT
jgi:putative transcriptional regulator